MKEQLTLVIMAAGMGSRFGGLKQITPVDDENNFLLDYSVYDAIKAGFNRIVFVIKKENLEAFKNTVGKRIEDKIETFYAFQDINDIPNISKKPIDRVKPWGTVQAILCARDYVKGSFAVINADDFYGYDSFKITADFLRNNHNDNEHISIPYPFCKVDSKFGKVKRGVLFYDKDNVKEIIECSIGYENDKVLAQPLSGDKEFYIEKDHPVSMNMFGFKNNFFDLLDEYFKEFFNDSKFDLNKDEALLPECILKNLRENKLVLKYKTSKSDWLGITYREDLESAKEQLQIKKNNNEYPKDLWN